MQMPLADRFPMYPGRAAGLLFGRGVSTVVLWADDYTVEEPPLASATPEDLEAFEQLLDDLRQHPRLPNLAAVHDAILSAGWEDRGMLKYKVLSGLLLVDAAALAEMADEMWREREEMLADAGGRHPEAESEVWAQWVAVTARRNASVRGSRALALAAVEALLNELLAAQHPDEYASWEIKKRLGFRRKLVKLLGLHDVNPDGLSWFEALDAHASLRNSMIHHRPSWIVDDSDEHSVAPNDDMTQESLAETLEVVHGAIAGLFALYEVQTPATHRPEWLRRTAGW